MKHLLALFALFCLTASAQNTIIERPKPTPTQHRPVSGPKKPKGGTSQKKPKISYKTFNVNGVSFQMVRVVAGTFTMGDEDSSDNEKPTHRVTLTKNYYIGKTEVTQALWKIVMGTNPSNFQGDNRPVENVSWNDCQTFISKLNAATGKNFRLPTEAEWEFAARGGNNSHHYWFSGGDELDNVAWHGRGNAGGHTHNVATRKPNELGAYDMSGNVMEWCNDWWGTYSSCSQTDPTGPYTGLYHVLRGGSWLNEPWFFRPSSRWNYNPDYRRDDIGFRLALTE